MKRCEICGKVTASRFCSLHDPRQKRLTKENKKDDDEKNKEI